MNNTIQYNFPTLESMLNQLDGYKNQLINAGLKVKYKMFVGNNKYYSIFVIE
jgi:hypothetical protein